VYVHDVHVQFRLICVVAISTVRPRVSPVRIRAFGGPKLCGLFTTQIFITQNFTMNIYVGNLPWSLSDTDLQDLFSQYGEVTSATIISDRDTGRSKGFAFVEMPDQSSGSTAIESLNGSELDGRDIRVNEARPRETRYPRQS
jgi:RNA recognition motif